ncbi:MAG: enoyl-CoA hydratase/isomerase family protein [Sneathiellales bacterium]|nr:enoyl-CoA hydratase/isomerase family protein [Sneathiellales bacterium]
MTDWVNIEKGDLGIARLTLNRGPVNALNTPFLEELNTCFKLLSKDEEVRAVILESPFKVFSAGLDLKETAGFSKQDETDIVDALNAAFLEMFRFPKPVIASVDGAAIAGGLFFPLIADYVIATETAKFGLSEVRVGACFPEGPMEIARAKLTPAGLNLLMLTGHPVGSQRAYEIGAVNEIVAREGLGKVTLTVAEDFARKPPQAFAAIKAQIRKTTIRYLEEVVKNRTDPTRSGWFTEETKAAMKAVLNGQA